MKILIVCSGQGGKISPFIKEQVDSLIKEGIEAKYFLIHSKGLIGYLGRFNKLQKMINNYRPDLIHAHYGLSGLLAVLQRKVPVVITFHGSDINIKRVRFFSNLAKRLSVWNIYVSWKIASIAKSKKSSVIPCGISLEIFHPIALEQARIELGLDKTKKYILFSSSFKNPIKNYRLAEAALHILNDSSIEMIELIGYNRQEVALLCNAADLILLTSFSEGSPQFIKEAMTCNRPIVSTDVGDVSWVLGEMEGCYICSYEPDDVAEKIQLALKFVHSKGQTEGRQRILDLGLDSETIAKRIISVYHSLF